MEKHFKLTDNTKTLSDGTVLHQIECTRNCKWAMKGELGGWIEKEGNLSGDAWVFDNAWVSGDALIENSRDYCCFQISDREMVQQPRFARKTGRYLSVADVFREA